MSIHDHGDPFVEWEEANAANEDGDAVMRAEREAAEHDDAREGQPAWEHTVTGYFGEKLTFTAYPPDEDDDGAATIAIEDTGDTRASIALTTREARKQAERDWLQARSIADGTRPLVFDLATPHLGWMLTEALDMWAAAQREKAAFEGGNPQREAWAKAAEQARAEVEAVP